MLQAWKAFEDYFGVAQEGELYAKFSKCDFWLDSAQFLGHVIDRNGVHVDPAKIEAIRNWVALMMLMEKDKKYEWGKEEDEAFQLLKQKLCSALILALPERTKDFVVYYDASLKGYEAMLMQREKQILEAQKEAIKKKNVNAKNLGRLIKQIFEFRPDGAHCFGNHVWLPRFGGLRDLTMHESHKFKYSIHLGSNKMYQELKLLYWWPNMKVDIATYVSKCLTCAKVKAEHQKPSGLLQQPKILVSKWERITMNFFSGLPRTPSGDDTIWVIVDRLTKSAHFLSTKKTDTMEKLTGGYGTAQGIVVEGRCALWKGVVRFRKRKKLSPRYIGLFKILTRVGHVAYTLELPEELKGIHSTFHVLNLKKCLAEGDIVVLIDKIQLNDKLHMIEEPMEIFDREVKRLKKVGYLS
nr:putative reverse transcriptase domain-containing protein [Tanacetum cinerariifolium]